MENEAITVITAMINTGGAVMEVPLKIAGEVSVELLQTVFSVLWNAFRQSSMEQNRIRRGECSLESLMMTRGTELQYCRIPEALKEDFLKDLESRGGLYTVLPDLNTEDKYFEFAFHATDTPKVNAACMRFHIGETEDAPVKEGIIGINDYIGNAAQGQLDGIKKAYGKELENQRKADVPSEYTITINKKKMLVKEDASYYYTYMPRTFNKEYGGFTGLLRVPKADARDVHKGQSIEYTLDPQKEYIVYDGRHYRRTGEFMEQMRFSGDDLLRHYNHRIGPETAGLKEHMAAVPEPVDVSVEKAAGPGKEARQAHNEAGTARSTDMIRTGNRKKKPAARFHNFNQREYDYGAMEMEFVRKLNEESQIHKFFTDEDIVHISEKYYLLRPESAENGQMLILPKEDVVYKTQDQEYEVTLKDKDYSRITEKKFLAMDFTGMETIDKKKAAEHMGALDVQRAEQLARKVAVRLGENKKTQTPEKVART